VSIAVALGSLLFAFALLVSLSFVDRPRGNAAPADEGFIAPMATVENATWGQMT
jgi:hypothetical protein